MTPGREFFCASLFGRFKPLLQECQQVIENFSDQASITSGLVVLPGQAGKNGCCQPMPAMPSQTGTAIHKTVHCLYGKKVAQQPCSKPGRRGKKGSHENCIQGGKAVPIRDMIQAVSTGRPAVIRLAGKHEGGLGKLVFAREEKSESRGLGKYQGGIPIRITGLEFHGLGFVDDPDAADLSIPRSGSSTACQVKRCLFIRQGSLCPGEFTGGKCRDA